MDFERNKYRAITGMIVDIVPAGVRNRRSEGCILFAMVEDTDGNTVNIMITPATYVVDFEPLTTGMMCTFWYDTNAPVPLIYPPRYHAVVAAVNRNSRMINVDYYNESFVNEERSLQLNLDDSVEIRTTNNQVFQGSPAGYDLVVIYDNSTRSIPAQTTPLKVIVLCPMMKY